MKRILLLIITSLIYLNTVTGQDLYINGTIGLNVGAVQSPITTGQQLFYYRAGSGIKLNAGLEYWTENNLILTGQVGYNSSILSYYYFNGFSSSYSFNWKTIETSISKYIPIEDSRNIDGLSFGGGLALAIPGLAKIVENDQELGSATYQTTLGYHLLFNGYITVNDLILVPGVRINVLNFNMLEIDTPRNGPTDERFFNQNTLGATFMMTFGKKINKVQD